MRILIADDSRTSRLQLASAVEEFGYEPLLAEDGAQAWDLIREQHVDVLITDWLMPNMTGEELCRRVRTLSPEDIQGYVYVILLTSLEERAHAVAAMRAGADDFLAKPLDNHDLEVRLLAATRVTELHHRLFHQNEELAKLNERIHAEARIDTLTQAGNRLRLEEDLATLSARTERSRSPFSIAMFDVDFFKKYNDSCGHPAGDEVLRQVTEALAAQRRKGDAVYRYGGEELVVVFGDTEVDSAVVAVERMRVEVERLKIAHPTRDDGHSCVTVSAGVAGYIDGSDEGPEEILERADTALYRAKRTGRNRVVIDESTEQRTQKASVLVIQRSLTQALANRIQLEGSGFSVSVVTSPESAIGIAQEEVPDAVLADLAGIDGVRLCERLRQEPALAKTPIVLTTTSEITDVDRKRAVKSGADAILPKGEAQDLITKVKSLINERREKVPTAV